MEDEQDAEQRKLEDDCNLITEVNERTQQFTPTDELTEIHRCKRLVPLERTGSAEKEEKKWD